jgi:hypothetical protein
MAQPRFWLLAMVFLLFLGGGGILIFLATNRTKARFESVQIGMAQEEVRRIMGESDKDVEQEIDLIPGCGMCWHNHDGFFLILFVDNKVMDKFAATDLPARVRIERLFREMIGGRKKKGGVAFP